MKAVEILKFSTKISSALTAKRRPLNLRPLSSPDPFQARSSPGLFRRSSGDERTLVAARFEMLENNANRANRRAFNWVINAALLNASLKLNFYQLVRVRRSDEDHKLNFPLGSGSIGGIVNGKVELSCSLGKRSDLEDPTNKSNTTDPTLQI